EVSLAPFADRLLSLQDARRNLVTIDPRAAARTLADVTRQVDSLRALFEPPTKGTAPATTKTIANRTAEDLDDVRGVVSTWFRYYDGYDPDFSWWAKDPWKKLDEALKRYARTLRERVVGKKTTDSTAAAENTGPIVGDPIGASGLQEDLDYEMIPYTPDELIAIAQREYAFSLTEMRRAARA